MSDLSYETSTLHSNLECIEEIDQALLTFDESFSMFLYGLRMNAFCVEWPEVSPIAVSLLNANDLNNLLDVKRLLEKKISSDRSKERISRRTLMGLVFVTSLLEPI